VAETPRSTRRWRRARLALPALLVVLATSACDPSFGFPKSITPQGERMRNMWIGSCIAGCVVGGFVVLLIAYAIIAYRKHGDELPAQVRYNLPIELLYTAVPMVIIGALFFYTARDEIYVMKTTKAPASHGVTVIDVEGFQWGWTFRYLDDSAKVGVPEGQAVYVTGSSNTTEPTLVVPSGTKIQFQEHSDDVIHSFWVPALLFKEDVIPGRDNNWEISKITREGTFRGHCAELCGYDHARMNFEMKVVSPAEYQQFLQQSKDQGRVQPVPDWVLKQTPAGSIS
jgi:cytochrome c oxidase subunit 2